MNSLNSSMLQEFYKVTPMREGILSWYPFAVGSSVLEQSSGALTELFHSRCDKAESFNVVYDGKNKFDYVIVIDSGEITTKLLKQYHSYMNPHGRLIMAFENPYGLQYFAGKRNPRTNLPFTFKQGESKAEVENRLKQAGFSGQKWYYPFTNLYFTREIYSEKYLPNEFLNHRGYIFVEDDHTKVFDERSLWKEVIRGGAFEFLCNSYLVEARVCSDDKECDIDYATVTAYREPEKAFATTIHNDGTVKKSALYPEGALHLEKMRDIHAELDRLGVNILPVDFINDTLVMKRLDCPTLWDYMGSNLINGTLEEDKVFSLFDRVREEILKSSKNGKRYWEMVPANCFYDEEKDELIFFDQEYFWEDVDPDVAVVRALYALKYSYHFRDDPRTKVWLEKLKERYGLTHKWDKLAEIADKKTREYVFNDIRIAPIDRELKNEVNRTAEKIAEHLSEQARYKKICVAADKLKKMGLSHPVIYGYGIRGKLLRYILESYGMDLACVIDKKMPVVKGLPLFQNIEKVNPEIEIDSIIITPANDTESIIEDLKIKVRCPIIALEELING